MINERKTPDKITCVSHAFRSLSIIFTPSHTVEKIRVLRNPRGLGLANVAHTVKKGSWPCVHTQTNKHHDGVRKNNLENSSFFFFLQFVRKSRQVCSIYLTQSYIVTRPKPILRKSFSLCMCVFVLPFVSVQL